MHERSVVRRIIEQVLEEKRTSGLGRIHEVQLQIGEFSGVEPELLKSAFAEMAPEYFGRDVRLVLEIVFLTAACETCGEMFPVKEFRFVCPECGGGRVRVTAGEEMRLVSIRAERRTEHRKAEL